MVDVSDRDSKTTVVHVKRMRALDEEQWFAFPPELQKLSQHTSLAALPPIKSAASILKNRDQYRNINVTLSGDIRKLYVDADDNFVLVFIIWRK